ncbi:MAG: DUF177 domain-containing protein [Bacteroidetes bacterium]|nr:DUF177 domain-containing protein [Bacteroidota bacterium]
MMEKDDGKYKIRVNGLKEGIHFFKFTVGLDFFENFSKPEIKQANVRIDLTLNKASQHLELEFNIAGTVGVVCDRCLDIFDLPVNSHNILFVKFNEHPQDNGDEVLFLSKDKEEINLMQNIYEFICLSLPLRKVHHNDENGNSSCNKEMLKKLEKFSYSKRSGNKPDSRWNELKKWKNIN